LAVRDGLRSQGIVRPVSLRIVACWLRMAEQPELLIRTAAQGRASQQGKPLPAAIPHKFFINPIRADWFWEVTARSPGG
jgi:hypothetical protein